MNALRARFRPLLLTFLMVLLGAWMPGSAWAGSFNRLPNPPPTSELSASEKSPEATEAAAEAAPPAAQAEEADSSQEDTAPAKEDEEATSKDSHASSEVETEEEASEEILPEGEPTYGEACIYGPQGVVHTPIGRDCEAEQAKREGAAKAASAARTQSEPGGSGRCIFGQRGEVVYAPPGVRCDGKVRETQKPKNADKTPRIIRYRPGR